MEYKQGLALPLQYHILIKTDFGTSIESAVRLCIAAREWVTLSSWLLFSLSVIPCEILLTNCFETSLKAKNYRCSFITNACNNIGYVLGS